MCTLDAIGNPCCSILRKEGNDIYIYIDITKLRETRSGAANWDLRRGMQLRKRSFCRVRFWSLFFWDLGSKMGTFWSDCGSQNGRKNYACRQTPFWLLSVSFFHSFSRRFWDEKQDASSGFRCAFWRLCSEGGVFKTTVNSSKKQRFQCPALTGLGSFSGWVCWTKRRRKRSSRRKWFSLAYGQVLRSFLVSKIYKLI